MRRQDIASIHGAMAHLDGMTQQNAALVEQSAAAANSLLGQAHELSALVGRFLLPQQPTPVPAPVPRVPAGRALLAGAGAYSPA